MTSMSIASAPDDFAFHSHREADNIFPDATRAPALSVVDWNVRNEASRRKQRMTERGRLFSKDIKFRNRELAFKKLKGAIERIKEIYNQPESDLDLLESERNKLDLLKDNLNNAQREYDELLTTEVEREESYRWFDLKDREYNECRLRICEEIQAFDRASYRTRSEKSSSVSSKSSSSRASSRRSSVTSVLLARADAAAKTAKLRVEMSFLEQESELNRVRLEKEIAIAKAEEEALSGVLDKTIEKTNRIDEREASNDKTDIKPNPDELKRQLETKLQLNSSASLSGNLDMNATLREIVNLQAKQTELSSLIISQQRATNLPVKEPPTFSGDPFEYPAFVTAFDTIIANNVLSDRDRIYFLDKYTSGKANAVVKGFLATSSEKAYQDARKLLDSRYGNPVHVAEAYKSSLRSWPQIHDGDSGAILEFSDFLVKCETAMKTMKSMSELDSTQILLQISAKLPSYCGVKWCRHAYDYQVKSGKTASFHDFVQFVQQEAELANDPVFSPEALMRERKKAASTRPRSKNDSTTRIHSKPSSGHTFATTAHAEEQAPSPSMHQAASSDRSCPVCNGKHGLAKCANFLKKSVEERSEFIRSNKLCFKCFRYGHMSSKCQSKQSCSDCGKNHHTALHGAKPKTRTQPFRQGEAKTQGANNNSPSAESANVYVSSSSSHDDPQAQAAVTNSKIVPIILYHKDNSEKQLKVYALLDDASDTTFVSTRVQQELEITGVETNLILSTMLGRELIKVSRIDGLVAERFDKGAKVELPKAYTRDRIPSRNDQIPTPETASKWPHLQRIKDKIPKLDETLHIGLLIGCNCPKAIKPREVITGKTDDPYAVRTLLGWCVIGPVSAPAASDSETSMCHSISAHEVLPETGGTVSIVLQSQSKEVIQPSMINKMFELDFVEHKKTSLQATSKEDRKFLQIAEDGIHQCDDGHYELPLPLKDSNVQLPSNRVLALHRLSYLKKRFERQPLYQDDYMKFMLKIIDNGYAEKAKPAKDNGRVWYIPHHGVYHPKKPNKIRVVFDCAAMFKNQSLNKHLLQGPDLTNNLVGVLHRFRQEPVALTCDIEGMFHQVKVNEGDRDLLRFLWWEDGDKSNDPQEYRMTVHLFGATSSPGCANFALKKTASDNEEEFGKEAADFIRKDFYVDDGLKSVASTEQAINLIRNVKGMCAKGGFHLHKFIANDKQVIKSVPEADRSDGIKDLNLDFESLPVERTLGVQWCVESDCFKFNIILQDKPCTRRGILSTVSSIFDPIGFVAPFMLEGKSILQELCRQDLDWDDAIPEAVKTRWEKWRADLLKLKTFSTARCFKPSGFGRVVSTELHHFSDASTKGYGQCSYLRLVDENDMIHCAFVTGKSRVAPLKTVTIPRLELTAALCSARIGQQLRQELEYTIDEDVYWTDSKVVLGYISNESKRFHVFVANRVEEIQKTTRVEQWRYIDTKQNPADEASRGVTTEDLPRSRWIQGPEFLWKDKSQWPTNSSHTDKVQEDDPEVKKSVAMATSVNVNQYATLEQRLEYFSDWHRAKKAVALCLRYVRILKERVKDRSPQSAAKEPEKLLVRDLEAAEHVILREVQATALGSEIASLKKLKTENPNSREFITARKNTMKTHSSLHKLDPFLDENELLRVGGRMRNAELTEGMKSPVILPRKSHLTSLIIRHFHERVKHQGRGMTLNEIRANGFWITGASSAVSSIIASCVKCHKLRGAVQEQRMADLPRDRVEAAPPFTSCGVDYFGPFMVKVGRKEVKRYGVLFTCMASRAIHIEVANSLDTDSFLNAYRRFVSRRGPIQLLRSDQGTNFVGARRELAQAVSEMDQQKITSKLLEDKCDWFPFKMNVPAASHMGGVWERQIRSVRNILAALLQSNGSQLDEESLQTLMCEAEAIVNSRPLTTDQMGDPDSPNPLTPSHLLTMKSKIVLPPPGVFQSEDLYCRKRWRRVQHLANEFWVRWRKEFLLSLQQRQKWIRPRRNLTVGDVVLGKDDNLPRNSWQLSRVAEVYPSSDGHVRKVKVATADGNLDKTGRRPGPVRYLERPVQKLVLLLPAEKNNEQ